MGAFAQTIADKYQLTREAQDDYALESLRRAQAAIAGHAFAGKSCRLFEINEAFVCVAMFAMRDLALPHDKVNMTALGHPIGASGTRIIATLIGALTTRAKKRGIARLCIEGGEATTVAIEPV